LNGGVPKADQALPGVKQSLDVIRNGQRDSKILELFAALQSNPQIRWKDSIKKVLRRYGLLDSIFIGVEPTQKKEAVLTPAKKAWATRRSRYLKN
jgi:hypothetical protein